MSLFRGSSGYPLLALAESIDKPFIPELVLIYRAKEIGAY